MKTIIKDGDELGKITLMPYFETFSRFDEEGKIRILRSAFGKYYNEEPVNLAKNENDFCEGLKKSVGTAGIWALLSTAEGSGTYSWRRGFNLIDMVREADKILNRSKEYEGKNITLIKSPGLYRQIREENS